ncbi:ImmA/IrrE family metallo-endopeptidase [Paraburkholderia sprentiae WSM5005]|uniref:ImmA/IrrE family metallo-endopeptidase n=1 Tax=Paraburkholderia sprentiae WSM5005 TaxID=754502 RepID=A0A1I9YI90_9BURK|nr:ImmA/IrrE family metallo-endopeptidase [Paraburkholderia sprentiae]APA86023.1 ImmA/IrrE family metallo-endopeptidase [Paraburkholderia sprentiae WSM5005]
MSPGERAENLIADFGITSPEDLDVVAFAYDAGLEVEFDELEGCDATLMGFENRAIATIRPSNVGRERFSIGHELGHWEMHRGKSFRCRVDDPGETLASNSEQEKHADEYAAHLLMPRPLLMPMVMSVERPSFKHINEFAEIFQTSRTATCIRLAQIDTLPIIAACYRGNDLRWLSRAPDVPKKWIVKRRLDEDSFAYDVMQHGKEMQGKQPAEVWFDDNDVAEEYEVMEHSARGRDGEVLVLIYLTDVEMMTPRSNRRREADDEISHGRYSRRR